MWCRRCQQDVRAVALPIPGTAACPRCHGALAPEPLVRRPAAANVATGIELDAPATIAAARPTSVATREDEAPTSVDPSPVAAPPLSLSRLPVDDPFTDVEEAAAELRGLGRRLHRPTTAANPFQTCRAAGRAGWEIGPAAQVDRSTPALPQPASVAALPCDRQRRAAPAWGLSLMLLAGVAGTISGILLLAVCPLAARLADQPLEVVWRFALSLTIAAEAALVCGLTSMAARLWRNSRRLNRQLDGMGTQLADLRGFAGRLGDEREAYRRAG